MIAASEMEGCTTNPSADGGLNTSSGQLFDGATDEYACYEWLPPQWVDAGEDITVYVLSSTSVTACDMGWALGSVQIEPGVTADDAVDGAEDTATDVAGAAKVINQSSAMTIGNAKVATSAIRPIKIMVHRDADGTDTCAADALLHGIVMEVKRQYVD
jgi:hypothetical protein